MAKIDAWKCDACGDEFIKGYPMVSSYIYNDKHGISVMIEQQTSMCDASGGYKLALNEVCGTCRKSLTNLVEEWVEKQKDGE